MFLNNISLGIYSDAIRSPAYRDAKVRTLPETAAEVMGPGIGELTLDLADDLGHEHRHPAIVLVSNNPYALDRPLVRGTRSALVIQTKFSSIAASQDVSRDCRRRRPGRRQPWDVLPIK
jgi:hypothetical protein